LKTAVTSLAVTREYKSRSDESEWKFSALEGRERSTTTTNNKIIK